VKNEIYVKLSFNASVILAVVEICRTLLDYAKLCTAVAVVVYMDIVICETEADICGTTSEN